MLETREIMLFKNYAPPFILQTLICFSCSHSLSRHSLSEHSFIVRSFVVRILKDRTLIVRTVILQPFIVRAFIVHLSENTIVWSIFDFDGITKAERAFVFKLSLCNPFARSAGIFYPLLRAFTRFYALLRAFKQFIPFTPFTPFTPLTVYSVCDSELLRCQSLKRAKLYVPKSRNLADLPAVKLINRQFRVTQFLSFRVTQFLSFIP